MQSLAVYKPHAQHLAGGGPVHIAPAAGSHGGGGGPAAAAAAQPAAAGSPAAAKPVGMRLRRTSVGTHAAGVPASPAVSAVQAAMAVATDAAAMLGGARTLPVSVAVA